VRPFSSNGLFPFWFPFVLFGAWIPVMSYLVIGACKAQARDDSPAREDLNV
jgi:hypothetical protein